MKKYPFILMFIVLCSTDIVYAQTDSYTTEPVMVSLTKNNPTYIALTKPDALSEEGKTRGFAKVKTKKIQLEGTVKDADGVRSLMINNFNIPILSDGSFASVLEVKEGDNTIVFQVTDKLGNQHIENVNFMGDISSNIDAISSLTDKPGKYYALLIGIDEYQDPAITDLDNPIKDAEAFATVLKQHYVFDEENVTVLKNATRREIIDALVAVRRKITPNDNFLLFYAGHGYYDETSDIGYWIPSDGRDKEVSTADWFRNSALVDEINAIKSKHTLLVADACFSGGIFKTRRAFMDASLAVNKLYELPSRKAMTSGALTEVPDESAFIQFLLKRLESNSDKYLTSEQLFSSFYMAVINNSGGVTPRYGTIQKVGDEGGDFVFIRRD